MQRIRIPNSATYTPVGLLDVMVAGPLVARVLLRSSRAATAVQLAAGATYARYAFEDWCARRAVRRIDFQRHFGAGVRRLTQPPLEEREADVRRLVGRLNDEYVTIRIPRAELAVEVDHHLTAFVASITGQWVETSTEIRDFSIARLIFPSALGACDFLGGDVALFRDTGIFEPHVIAHEFAHRKGYWKELEAQALAYLSLVRSGEPVLVQSALAERLHRQLRVLATDRKAQFPELVRRAGLRAELERNFLALHPKPDPLMRRLDGIMRAMYDRRMRLTGQNGISDYDRGFTSFLYTVESRSGAENEGAGAAAPQD